jgi:hypothetical protein
MSRHDHLRIYFLMMSDNTFKETSILIIEGWGSQSAYDILRGYL